VVIEAHVDAGLAVNLERRHDTYLVKAGIGLVTAAHAVALHAVLPYQSAGDTHLGTAEEACTGRVAGHRRDVGTQRLHSATHTYVAGGTVEVVADELGILICLLGGGCQGSHRSQ